MVGAGPGRGASGDLQRCHKQFNVQRDRVVVIIIIVIIIIVIIIIINNDS